MQDPGTATLHYIFDPLCGWCYGAAPLVEATRRIDGIRVKLHAGGMMVGPQRRNIDTQWREFVLPHDLRIADVSGQPFGAPYFDVLLHDTSAVLDSEPPIAAVLAAEAVDQRGFELLHAIQKAHYVRGLRIAEPSVLTMLATEIGLDMATFDEQFTRMAGEPTHAHIINSRKLLARIGGRGFPTVALQLGHGTPAVIDVSTFLGRPQAWVDHVAKRVGGAVPAATGTSPSCDIDGCTPSH